MKFLPELSAKTTINNGQTFYDQEQFKRHCHFIYLESERQLSSELRVSQWTMLGKMMRLVYESYLEHYDNDCEHLRKEFETQIQPAKDFLEHDFSEKSITFCKFSETFKRRCKENSAGLACDFTPVLNIYNLNWFYKTLQIQVTEDNPDHHFDSEEIGSGMQNLLLLSIFQTYTELMGGKVIFGIEEPEIYLYPHAQRSLYASLKTLSEKSQIFYSTHNQNFVDATRPDDIILLRKDKAAGTFVLEKDPRFNKDTAAAYYHKTYAHFNTDRNELFFAKKVLLVEGDSDKILFQTLSNDKWNIPIDSKGISIIACGGKGGVVYFINVCHWVGISEFYAIWDKDDDGLDCNNVLTNAIESSHGLEFTPNLEQVLGLPTGKGASKIKNAFDWATNIAPEDIPEIFNSVKLFLSQD
jgi:predicted ATP-dependent endonuclease of OLD family